MSYEADDLEIVVADDTALTVSQIRSLLGRLGFSRIHEAVNAEDAWQLCQEHNPDIVLVVWPAGQELVRRLRRDPATPNRFVPIIGMMNYADSASIAAAHTAGVTELLLKPLKLRGLETVIERPRSFVETGTYFGPDRRQPPLLFRPGLMANSGTVEKEDRRKVSFHNPQQTFGRRAGNGGLPEYWIAKAKASLWP
jgi:two-component system chemotaxis response regulator CheY